MFLTLVLISLAYLIIILLEVPRLVTQRRWRELVVVTLLLLPAMAYSYGLALGLNSLPNPAQFIEAALKPLADQLVSLLGTAQK